MKIGIVGLGLMGGSIAKALKPNHDIIAYDIDKNAISYAIDHQIIQEGTQNLEIFFQNLDVVFLCLYPHSIPEFIHNHHQLIHKDTIVIEISGIKQDMMKNLSKYHSSFDIVFTHPIAGREKRGVSYSNNQIFQNANFVIVPTKENKAKSIETTKLLAIEMGFKNITEISMEEHDDIIAYTSQLTHVISLALVNSDNQDYDTSLFIGDSYRDLTRISMINEDLWSELFLSNKDFLLKRIQSFENYIDQYKDAITNNDIEKLKTLMRDSKEKRLEIESRKK